MSAQNLAPPDAAALPGSGPLLIVSSETGNAYDELERLSTSARRAAICVRLDASARVALSRMIGSGGSTVVAVPLSCGIGEPEDIDVAGLLRWAKSRWPHVTFLQADRFAAREHLVGWASRRAQQSLTRPSIATSAARTGALVVGPGSTPANNAEVSAVAQLVAEHHDYDFVESAFARNGRPTIPEAIDRCRRLGVQRIVVVPLTILDGPCFGEITSIVEAVQRSDHALHIAIAPGLLTPASAAMIVAHRSAGALERWWRFGVDGCTAPHTHAGSEGESPVHSLEDVLPPRYRQTRAVSAATMRSAPLQYDGNGNVAWDRMWQSFCDLALAGGPPHRGTLLEPPTREDVLADPDGSARVAREIARGLSLTTRMPVTIDAAPGWVGLLCGDEEMAVWLLRAIVVENISVRRQGATLFLPAGPAYRVEKEIKNVITAVAKTHHYWTEHRSSRG